MQKKKIIGLLNADLQDEHSAIIQYLDQAYVMRGGEMSCEVEAISRDEMCHLDWLAKAIVALGGIPSLDRSKMMMSGKRVTEWMSNDVILEESAIAQYREQINLIDNPRIKRLLKRIFSDEEAHWDKFTQDVGSGYYRPGETTRKLNWAIEHEYTVILQYLFHSYMTTSPETKNQFENQAVN